MSEKIKVRFTVPETLAESANRFLKSLAYPTQKPDGELSPPTPISVERESGLLGDYFVESLKFRSLGVDVGGSPRAMAVEILAIPIKPMKIDVDSGPCEFCHGTGYILTAEFFKPKTVENAEEFKGEFGDGETFPSDPKKQELKRRILDRMTARDMVDTISDGCDLPNLADIIIDLFPEEEILDMTSSVVIEKDKETFGESKLPSALLSAKGVAELKDRFEERHRGTENNDCPECLGTGKKFIGEPDERDCERCDGTGRATEREGENR